MTEPVGYAAVQLIPSLQGFSDAVNKQLGGALRVTAAKGGRDFNKGFADGMKSSESDIKRAFDNQAKLADRAADSLGKLKVAQAGVKDLQDKGITSGQKYERAIQAQEKAQRDNTRATKTAADALRDYEQAAKRAEGAGSNVGSGVLSSLRGVAQSAGGAGSEAAAGFAEGFAGSSAIVRLGSAAGPVGTAFAAAGVVLGGLLWKNVQAGFEREPGRDLIQARLGASDAEIAAIARVSGEVYANNFGESRDEAMRASQLAIQGGLVADAFDPALQQVSERMLAIGDLIGTGVEDVAKSASILFRSGMADSAEQAFDIIAKGYQVTGDLGADWLDSIGEYSSGWKNAGLSAEQALALIKQAQDNGVDVTDRSADALREFGRRVTEEGPKMVEVLDAIGLNGEAMYAKFKEGGPAAFQAFDEVFDKIRSLEDPVDRNQAAMALLGDTAGDFIGAFAQWDPSAAVQGLGDIDGAARNASNTLGNNVVGAWESAKRSIEVSLEGVQDALAETFGPDLQRAAEWVKDHNDDIGNFFIGMAEIAVSAGASVLGAVGEITEAIGQLVGGIGNVQGTVLKFQAWQAEVRGDSDVAAELREQSEAAFGWGDGLEALGTQMRITASKGDEWLAHLRELKDGLRDTSGEADGAKDSVAGVGTSVDRLKDSINNLPKDLPPWMTSLATGGPGVPGQNGTPGQNPLLAPYLPGAPPAQNPLLAPYTGSPPAPPGAPPIPAATRGAVAPASYGLPNDTDIRQGAAGFPDWVYQMGEAFGLKASTYSGHQTDRGQGNQGIDWWGPVENQQRFAEFLAANRGMPGLEDVIWQNPNTGQAIGVNQGRLVGTPGSEDPMYFRRGHNDFADHTDHVHTTQSQALALPSGTGAAVPVVLSSNTTAASPLTPNSTPDQVAAAIIGQAQSRGFNRDQTIAVLSTALQESGLNPAASGGGGAWHGIFQQDASYPGRDDPNANIAAFFDRLGAPGDDIWRQIFGLQQGTSYDSSGARTAYLTEIQSQVAKATGMVDGAAGQYAASGPTSPNLTNAFGPGYKPGIGTPGYNEYGEPGYYQTDPRRIAQAQRSVEDNRIRIADTESAITEADTTLADALKERDRIAKLTEVQRATAGEDLDKANADVERAQKQADRARLDAQRAKEDAQWVQEDLNEAMQGSFQSAKADSGRGGGSGSGLNLGSSLSGIGSALGEFAGGQLGSALDVFGVPDSPGWLQGLSTFVGGISIGGGGGANPLSAAPNAASTLLSPDTTIHGSAAGQAPGPTYNIQTAKVEDAFLQARRIENEKALAKLSRF
ncbi:phage tail tape measure protein [Micrococcus luteus]|uniref:phage tail tape measure protein n=1 Tax=Micrococcus luteus TaxID=1270 RepID=UPI0034153C90